MNIETLLLIVTLVLLAGILPIWPYSREWGHSPMNVLTMVTVVFLVWAMAGGRPLFKSKGSDLRETFQLAGDDMKSTGRDMAASVKRSFR